MKKFFLLLLFIVLIFGLNAKNTENPDNPVKGKWDFDPVELWGVEKAGDDILTRGRITIGDNGNTYFLDTKIQKVFVFDNSGKFINTFGRKGEGPGEFKYPFQIVSLNKKIIIIEYDKLNVFSEEGKFLYTKKYGFDKFPRSFIDENTFVFKNKDEEGNESLKKYDLITKKETMITKLDLGGKQTKGLNIIGGSYPIYSNSENVFYAKSKTCKIVKFDLQGKEIHSFSIKERQKKEVTREEKLRRAGKKRVKMLKNATVGGKSALDAYLKAMPGKDPFYNRIFISKQGLLYAFIPGKKNGLKIDIFSQEGKYLYRANLKLPDDIKIIGSPFFSEKFLIAFTEDEEGELSLNKYKIKIPGV